MPPQLHDRASNVARMVSRLASWRRRSSPGVELAVRSSSSPSGAHRVRVYAGYDPVTGKRHYLDEVVPAGPRSAAEAEKVRTRFLSQVDEKRNPKTRATVNQPLDRYLTVLDVDAST